MKRQFFLSLAFVMAAGGLVPAATAEESGNVRDQGNWVATNGNGSNWSSDDKVLWDRNEYRSTDMA
jgi:hypothetical protein